LPAAWLIIKIEKFMTKFMRQSIIIYNFYLNKLLQSCLKSTILIINNIQFFAINYNELNIKWWCHLFKILFLIRMPPIYQRWLRRVLFIFAFILLLRTIGLFNYLYLTSYSKLHWPHLEAEKLRNEVRIEGKLIKILIKSIFSNFLGQSSNARNARQNSRILQFVPICANNQSKMHYEFEEGFGQFFRAHCGSICARQKWSN